MDSVPRDRPEIEAAIPQSRLGIADLGEPSYRLVEYVIGVEGVGLSPQRLAHELVAVPTAMKSLLGAVIQARDTLKSEQYSDAEDDLRVEPVGPVRACSTEPFIHVMVVKECYEEPSRLAVAAQDVALHLLAAAVDVDDVGGRGESLG